MDFLMIDISGSLSLPAESRNSLLFLIWNDLSEDNQIIGVFFQPSFVSAERFNKPSTQLYKPVSILSMVEGKKGISSVISLTVEYPVSSSYAISSNFKSVFDLSK